MEASSEEERENRPGSPNDSGCGEDAEMTPDIGAVEIYGNNRTGLLIGLG